MNERNLITHITLSSLGNSKVLVALCQEWDKDQHYGDMPHNCRDGLLCFEFSLNSLISLSSITVAGQSNLAWYVLVCIQHLSQISWKARAAKLENVLVF